MFKIEDKVTLKKPCGSNIIPGSIYVLSNGCYGLGIYLENNQYDYCTCVEKWILVDNKIVKEVNMTKKTIYNVLVVDKKTSKIEKDVTVVSDDERHAILKAYGINVDKLSFTVTGRAEFEEDKPQTVVLEKVK